MTKLIWRQIAERDGRRMRNPFSNPWPSGTTEDHTFAEAFNGDRLPASGSTLLLRGDDDLGYQLARRPLE